MLVSIELWTAFVLLVGLIFLSRLRKYMGNTPTDGFTSIALGFTILALSALARELQNQNFYADLPFFSDPIFFRLFNWITVITGIIFAANGISRWLPLSRSYLKNNESEIKKLSLLKYVGQILSVESRPQVIFERALSHMVDLYDLSAGLVLMHSKVRDELIEIARIDENKELQEFSLKRLNLDFSKYSSSTLSLKNKVDSSLSDEIAEPGLIIPICPLGIETGMVILWNTHHSIDPENRINLKLAVDAIAQRIETEALRERARHNSRTQDSLMSIREVLDHNESMRDNIPGIVNRLKKHFDFEFFSLAYTKGDREVHRWAVGSNGSILSEIGIERESYLTEVDALISNDFPVIVNNLHMNDHAKRDQLLMNSGMKSMILCPIRSGEKLIGIMTLAASKADWFSARDAHALVPSVDMIGMLLNLELRSIELKRTKRSRARLVRFVERAGRNTDIDDLMHDAANLLADEIGSTMVRISSIDQTGSFADSRALVIQQPLQDITPSDGHLILSLMPYHSEVLQAGRLMLINQEDTSKQMDEVECSLALFKELNSTLLIPIKCGTRVSGIIALAEMREWDRFRFEQPHIELAEMVAMVLAGRINELEEVSTITDETSSDLGKSTTRLNIAEGSESFVNFTAPDRFTDTKVFETATQIGTEKP